MSVPEALRFIALVRNDPELARQIRALGPDASLERLAGEGASRGIHFSADDLRAAYKFDWKMRFAHGARPTESGSE